MSRMMNNHRAKRRASATDFQTDRGLDITQPKVDDVRVAGKIAGAAKGKYIALFQTPKNTLELIPTHTSVAEFINDNADHLGNDILAVVDPKGEKNAEGQARHDVWGDKQVLKELVQDHLGTGWHWLEPKDIGQLTEAPILEAPDGRIYFHNDYHRLSSSDELLKGKTVSFDGAPENHVPVIEPVEEAIDDMPKAAAAKTSAEERRCGDCNTVLGEDEKGLCKSCHFTKVNGSKPKKAGDPAAEDPTMTAPAPTPVASSTGNPYQDWKTQNLIETIESLTDSETFAQDKPEQNAVQQMAEVLSARPVEPAEPEGQAKKSALRKAAAVLRLVRRAGFGPGGAFQPVDKDNAKVLEGDKTLPEGREFEEDNTGITVPAADSARKFAGINDPAASDETAEVLEGDKSVAEEPTGVEDNTGVTNPATDTPSKFASGYEELGVKTAAAPITVDKAIKLVEDLSDELKALYMDAKPITTVNESRQVRDAVESIYHAMKALGNAQKILVKQQTQEEEEAKAAVANAAKAKKSSSLMSALKIAAAEPEAKPASHVATFKDRATFRAAVAKQSSLGHEAAGELADAIMRSASAFGIAHRASIAEDVTDESKQAFEAKKAHLKNKISSLAIQLSCTASYRTDKNGGRSVALLAGTTKIEVPTS